MPPSTQAAARLRGLLASGRGGLCSGRGSSLLADGGSLVRDELAGVEAERVVVDTAEIPEEEAEEDRACEDIEDAVPVISEVTVMTLPPSAHAQAIG